jgi:hypothetical protein
VKRILLVILVISLLPVLAFGHTIEGNKPIEYLSDADIALGLNPADSFHLDSNHVWILTDGVFVDSGCILSIDPGTIIKGQPGTGADSKYLCVARHGKIYANGTEDKPIIFTGDVDNVDDPYDIELGTNGLWGGVIILGTSVCNTPTGYGQIEGIPSDEPRGLYGGGTFPDSLDNSGVFRYVSIRHGGTEIGAANEINGLTMGAVGAGTTIEYVEVFNNYDDGYEWFGGTVNTRYLVSAFNGDDAFDYDEGFRGYHQFWFAVQDSSIGNHCGEHDGSTGDEQGTPYAEPYIYNCTYIGSGANSANADNSIALLLRDNAGGHYINGIITDVVGYAVQVEDVATPGVHDSRERIENGDLTFEGMFFYNFGAGTDPAVLFQGDWAYQHVSDPANDNTWDTDPMLMQIDRHENLHLLDPRLDPASPANTPGVPEPSDPFFTDVDYRGAFPPVADKGSLQGLWISNWTNLWQRSVVQFVCGDANGDAAVNVSDAVFIINFIFVEGAAPFPYMSGNANCDANVNVSDAVYIINYVFVGGSAPCDCN